MTEHHYTHSMISVNCDEYSFIWMDLPKCHPQFFMVTFRNTQILQIPIVVTVSQMYMHQGMIISAGNRGQS